VTKKGQGYCPIDWKHVKKESHNTKMLCLGKNDSCGFFYDSHGKQLVDWWDQLNKWRLDWWKFEFLEDFVREFKQIDRFPNCTKAHMWLTSHAMVFFS